MKKIVLLLIAALSVFVLILAGPSLLDLYRLQEYISTSSATADAESGPWPRLTDVCAGCHGVNGHSQSQIYPSLAGQPSAYITAQLKDFADGRRANPTMGPLAMTLSDLEIRQLSDYFSQKPVVANSSIAVDPSLQERGKKLVETRGCAACHGAQFEGRASFPRIAGLGDEYLLAQLEAFASGARVEATGTMKALAAAASPDERKAIAMYLASFTSQPSMSAKGQ